MSEYPTSDIATIALVHGENMEAAGICRQRHAALVDYLESYGQ